MALGAVGPQALLEGFASGLALGAVGPQALLEGFASGSALGADGFASGLVLGARGVSLGARGVSLGSEGFAVGACFGPDVAVQCEDKRRDRHVDREQRRAYGYDGFGFLTELEHGAAPPGPESGLNGWDMQPCLTRSKAPDMDAGAGVADGCDEPGRATRARLVSRVRYRRDCGGWSDRNRKPFPVSLGGAKP